MMSKFFSSRGKGDSRATEEGIKQFPDNGAPTADNASGIVGKCHQPFSWN
jgi:hypothetical protein